jgi:hypothetical protein
MSEITDIPVKIRQAKPTISEFAAAFGLTRQRAWQVIRELAGLCSICGHKKPKKSTRCTSCAKKNKERAQEKRAA